MSDTTSPRLDALIAIIAAANPMQARALAHARAALSADECSGLESYIGFCSVDGVDIQALAVAYQTITMDTLREQVFFQRNGRYRYSSFAEVADKVYFDADYMSRYMYGLALTLYLWPNHLEIMRFFRRALAQARGGRYLEVGPGHGVFFKQALQSGCFDHCAGIDISKTSLELTRRLLVADKRLRSDAWKLLCGDFLGFDGLVGKFDAIVMGEVLEHVEDPLRFLQRIADLAVDNAFIFVTTAVNAPAVDHIFHFKSVQEVVELSGCAGLRVVEVVAPPYTGCTMEDTVARKLPINVAMLLTK